MNSHESPNLWIRLCLQDILDRVKNELTPREPDGNYMAYQVQKIVDEKLHAPFSCWNCVKAEKKHCPHCILTFDEIKNILLDAHRLKIPFLVDAVARVLVHADENRAERIVQDQSDEVPKELHIYLKKHLEL